MKCGSSPVETARKQNRNGGSKTADRTNGHGKIVWRKRIVNGRDSGGIDKGNRCRSNAISEDADTNSVGTVIDGDITAGGKHAGDHAWRNDVTSCDDAGRTGCENTAGN